MNPERYQQIGRIYHSALEMELERRAAFLNKACGADEELRRRVEALLAAHDQTENLMETPALEVAAGLLRQQAGVAGRNIGHYQVLSLLGRGGMGEVYLAEDTHLGRKVALKLLPDVFTRDEERVRRFGQEAKAVSALNHPNIITIFEVGRVDEAHFIATEYIKGQTLRQRLKGGTTEQGEALDIVIQIASALQAAHDAGIVHRDIKPENVMVRPDGIVKVLDFGLAKLIEKRPVSQITVADDEAPTAMSVKTLPGVVIGTVAYMSPEQAKGVELDGRSDLFSLGVVIYEMVVGRALFEGPTPAEMLAAVLHQDAPPLRCDAPEASAELERIVAKALQKELAERYQTAKDLLTDLKSLKLELEIEARLQRAAPPETRREAEPARQSPKPETPLVPPALPSSDSTVLGALLEPVGGAVPLESRFYVVRPTDEKLRAAIARQDSIVLVKGARQVGKTSLLARGLEQARAAGAKVVLTDFQNLSPADLESFEKLLRSCADAFADQLDLDVSPQEFWKVDRSPGINFEQYLRRAVLARVPAPIVWGLDEVDRLFTCDFGSAVFGLFRSWHNKRALDPAGPWRRLTLAIAYATEAHLFITDLNQSPFNVGTRLQLDDFISSQVVELNRRYGSPLRTEEEEARFFRLVGGHPHLVRRGLYEMVSNGLDLAALEAQAAHDEGPFGDHLRRLLISLTQDAGLCEVARGVLRGKPCPTPESFYRLRSAGLMSGDSESDVRPRCRLYAT
jgi:serine/threonine protein kinase